MSARATFRLLKLMRDGAIRSMAEITEAGISRMTVKRAVEAEKLVRFNRGHYVSAELELPANLSLASISKSIDGVICLGSAAQMHELGDEDPSSIWIAVDRTAYGRSQLRSVYDPHQLVFWQGKFLTSGVETMSIAGVPVKVTSAARTVVDLLSARKSLGEDVGPKALMDYLKSGKPMNDLWEIAQELGVYDDLVPFFRVAEEFREGMTPATRVS